MTDRIACPHCGKAVDGIASLREAGQQIPGGPKDGDFAFCTACGQWACWEALALRVPTDDEYMDLFFDWDAVKVMLAWVAAQLDPRKPTEH